VLDDWVARMDAAKERDASSTAGAELDGLGPDGARRLALLDIQASHSQEATCKVTKSPKESGGWVAGQLRLSTVEVSSTHPACPRAYLGPDSRDQSRVAIEVEIAIPYA
jgi:hypothetical protein